MSVRGSSCAPAVAALAAAVLMTMPVTHAGTPSYRAIVLYTLSPAPGNVDSILPTGNGVDVVGAENSGAMIWTPVMGSSLPSPYPPGPITISEAYSAYGNEQVGYLSYGSSSQSHAMLWNGTNAPPVDLQPSQFTPFNASAAYGIAGQQQVGAVWQSPSTSSSPTHAVLWTGSAASAVDLNPDGFTSSVAKGTDGVHQVGFGTNSQTGSTGALLWSGTADSAISLQPTRLPFFGFTEAVGLFGNQEVGDGDWGGTGSAVHALLWNGTADSAVDLNPSAYDRSYAVATNGKVQVGYGADFSVSDQFRALAWTGSSASAIELQSLLPSNYLTSEAMAVDAAGNIYGVASDAPSPYVLDQVVEWQIVPEPGGLTGLALCLGMLIRPRSHARERK